MAARSDRSRNRTRIDIHLRRSDADVFEVVKSPLVQAAHADAFLREGTPERVEFENSITDQTAEEEELSEIDEDEWTDHNFGNSIVSSSAEASSGSQVTF